MGHKEVLRRPDRDSCLMVSLIFISREVIILIVLVGVILYPNKQVTLGLSIDLQLLVRFSPLIPQVKRVELEPLFLERWYPVVKDAEKGVFLTLIHTIIRQRWAHINMLSNLFFKIFIRGNGHFRPSIIFPEFTSQVYKLNFDFRHIELLARQRFLTLTTQAGLHPVTLPHRHEQPSY